jgi:ubiquinone/menaquinone biosynthesis C-methylase UbiE
MDQHLNEISEQQKATWNRFSTGWEKWDALFMDFLSPMGGAIINGLKVQDGDWVLDVAAGTGEPGLTIAKLNPNGRVVITDLSEKMLDIAKSNAEAKGLHNIQTRVCDASELPFPDMSFDSISCRMGLMFFPDMEVSIKEMVRVLKPGGRLSVSVWAGPEKNFWITAIMGTIAEHIELAPVSPGDPGMFRCAQDGLIADLFKKTGLQQVEQQEVHSLLKTGTAELYWDIMNEAAGPPVLALSKADPSIVEKIKGITISKVKARYPDDGEVMIDASSWVISGTK